MKGLDPDLRALQEMRDAVAAAKAAMKVIANYTQAEVDRLVKAMADAGAKAAFDLARLAVDETGIGRVHYKVLKNLLGSEGVWDSIKDEKTVGIVTRDERLGLIEVATPVGVVAGIVPTTNPTSTAMFKALISVKARNAVVISPHPRAKRCIGEAVEILRRAIARAGGPPDLVVALSNPTIESTGALMKHRDIGVILSTGGGGLVKAAYSSGKPAYGVGPGNVPAYVDRTANVEQVAEDLVSSQSFDNATLCCSEQAIVVDRPVAQRLMSALRQRGAHLCNDQETQLLEKYANVGGHMNPDIVGIDPWRIAEKAGFHVSRSTTVLLAYQGGVGKAFPLSIEILCPLLSVHVVDGWEEGCRISMETLHYGGLGHTLAVHAGDESVLEAFFLQKPASRIVANGPSSMGAVGFSTNLVPSFSLGCGPQAGNITSDNITARHLVNLKRVAFPRRDWKEIERSYHARASAFTGDPAPRGSGMPGDPGMEGSVRGVAASTPSMPSMPAAPVRQAAARAPVPRPVVTKAPTFTRPSTAPAGGPSARPKLPNPTVHAAPPINIPSGHQAPPARVGLGPSDIQSILAKAGDGCPMGPCKGCPQHNVSTGACDA
ncbi:MAG: acetaldehyde dehydrogenase (acetylating) [Planctomycetota bacterium]